MLEPENAVSRRLLARGYTLRSTLLSELGTGLESFEWGEKMPKNVRPVIDPGHEYLRWVDPVRFNDVWQDGQDTVSIPRFHPWGRHTDPEEEGGWQRTVAGYADLVRTRDGGMEPDPAGIPKLAAIRDALAVQARRCVDRLAQPSPWPAGELSKRGPMLGALAVIKAWHLEAEIALLGGTWEEVSLKELGPEMTGKAMRLAESARHLWRGVRQGIGEEHLLKWNGNWIRQLSALLPKEINQSARYGLRLYLRQRDAILAEAGQFWFRLEAAEVVLHRALLGKPLDAEWLAEANAQREAALEEERRAGLRGSPRPETEERYRRALVSVLLRDRPEWGAKLLPPQDRWRGEMYPTRIFAALEDKLDLNGNPPGDAARKALGKLVTHGKLPLSKWPGGGRRGVEAWITCAQRIAAEYCG